MQLGPMRAQATAAQERCRDYQEPIGRPLQPIMNSSQLNICNSPSKGLGILILRLQKWPTNMRCSRSLGVCLSGYPKFNYADNYSGGSFGVVYKAIEKDTGEIVAIKHVRTKSVVLTSNANSRQIDLEGSDDDIREIQQEISLLSTCASPFVTHYKTSFIRGVKLWIVMEYLGGGSCLDLVGVHNSQCQAKQCTDFVTSSSLAPFPKHISPLCAANYCLASITFIKPEKFIVISKRPMSYSHSLERSR